MPRGRGRGRGGRGRGGRGRGRGGRGRGAVAVVTVSAAASGEDPGDEAAATAMEPAATPIGRGGRGRGRGRGDTGRGSVAAARSGRGRAAVVSVESITNTNTDALAPVSVVGLTTSPAPPVVVVVPKGRMITRSLLRGTAALLLSSDGDAIGDPLTPPLLDGRRRRRTAAGDRVPGGPPRDSSSPSSSPSAGAVSARGAVGGEVGPLARQPSPRVVMGGLLQCVCAAFLVSPSETLLECCRCRNWCHPACVGVDHEEVRLHQRQRDYVCPFCATAAAVVASPTSLHDGGDTAARRAAPSPQQQQQQPGLLRTASPRPASITTPLGESIQVVVTPITAPASAAGSPAGRTSPRVGDAPAAVAVVTAVDGVAVAGADHVNGHSHPPALPPSLSPGSGAAGTPVSHLSRRPPAPRQVPLKLREVNDEAPPAPLADELRRLLRSVEDTARAMGYEVLHLPAHMLTERQVAESLECCAEAIRDATFSADYPAYCLKEVQSQRHPYVQGIALQSRADGRVCSLMLSSGRDLYGNLKSTITQLKSSLQRGLLQPAALTPFMAECMAITDVADFVHITLSATHVQHQRRGLARLLMAMDLLRWALRGRRRAFLNMAIEKRLADGGSRIEFASPVASKRLYESFGFVEVYPRYDPVTQKERWTAKEADMGRVMANLNFLGRVCAVAETMPARYAHQLAGATVPGDDRAGHGERHVDAALATASTTRDSGRADAEGSAERASSIASGSSLSRPRSDRRATTSSGSGGGHLRKRSSSPAVHGGEDGDGERHDSGGAATQRRRLTLLQD